MPLGGPGPRDWSPAPSNEPVVMQRPVRWATPPSTSTRGDAWSSSRRRSSVSGLATISFSAGLLALGVMLLQPANDETTQGFFLSTVGATAIVTGAQALRRGRYGRSVPRALARAGVVMGSVGSAAVVWTLLSFLVLPLGITLPSLPTSLSSWLPTSGASFLGPAPLGVAADSTGTGGVETAQTEVLPAQPLAPTTPEDEVLQLTQAAGTLSYVLGQTHPANSPWPDHLLVTSAPGPIVVSSPEGVALGTLPAGTQIVYSVTADRSVYALDLVGGTFGGAVHYDSAAGVVSTR